MQLPEIKSFVRSHLTDREIKAWGYDLADPESWEVLADRCREYAAAKLEQAAEFTKEVAIELKDAALLLVAHCDGLPIAICETAQTVLVWVMSQVIIGWFFWQEMVREGAIASLMADVQQIEQQRESRVLSLLDHRLASSWKIAA